MEFPNITYKYILNLYQSLNTNDQVYRAVIDKINEKKEILLNDDEQFKLKTKIRKVKSTYKQMSDKKTRHKERFLEKFEQKVLKITVNTFPSSQPIEDSLDNFTYDNDENNKENEPVNESLPVKLGKRTFSDYADRTKRQKLEIAGTTLKNDMEAAFRLAIKVAKKNNLPKMVTLLGLISNFNEGESENIVKIIKNKPKPLTTMEAVAFMHEYSLSVNTYIKIQQDLKQRNYDMLPSYHTIKPERYACHPSNIISSPISVEVPVVDLIRHTVARLLLECKEVLTSLIINKPLLKLTFACSLGMDGSSNMALFDSENFCRKSSSILSTTLTYLLLYEKNTKKIVYNNLQASSTRTNRPIKIDLTKETRENCKREFFKIKNELENMPPLTFDIHGMKIVVDVEWIFSQIDGKVLSALTDTASMQVCQFCSATPLVFNKYRNDHQGYELDSNKLIFGLGSLHLLLRSYGFFLDLGVRGKCKKWRRSSQQKDKHNKTNKLRIQKEMKDKLNIFAMFPKGNLGSSDTGNAARIAFKNHKIFAEILRVEPELIKRFYIILTAISVQYHLKIDKFKQYLEDTEAIYLEVTFLI